MLRQLVRNVSLVAIGIVALNDPGVEAQKPTETRRARPIWKDGAACVGNLSGSFTGTLKNPVIREEGRRFLADLLVQLSDQQLQDMFAAARVDLRPRAPQDGRS